MGIESLVPVLSSFLIVVLLMPQFIKYLQARDVEQTILDDGPKWHEKKAGTPTMGGLIFLIAIVVTNFWVGKLWDQLTIPGAMITGALIGYGIIGFLDDSIKIFKKRNMGLTASQKYTGQLLVAIVFLLAYFKNDYSIDLYMPFYGMTHSYVLYFIFAVIWLTGFSNAVNLTDGLDGLVTGLSFIAYGTYGIIAVHDGRADVLLICLSVVGAMAGFFIFNHKPAKIFMGDVGSLALGGGLAAISIMLKREWSLLLIGLVFVIETFSVILQIFSFKVFHKRIFKMTPIHHHFEMMGWSEWKIDITFWIFAIICSAIYLAIWL